MELDEEFKNFWLDPIHRDIQINFLLVRLELVLWLLSGASMIWEITWPFCDK